MSFSASSVQVQCRELFPKLTLLVDTKNSSGRKTNRTRGLRRCLVSWASRHRKLTQSFGLERRAFSDPRQSARGCLLLGVFSPQENLRNPASLSTSRKLLRLCVRCPWKSGSTRKVSTMSQSILVHMLKIFIELWAYQRSSSFILLTPSEPR